MDSIYNKKQHNPDNTESWLASSIHIPTIIPSNQSCSSNIYNICSDPKHFTSPRCAAIQIENKESNSLNSPTEFNYTRFISMAKANIISDLSLTMCPTEWTTLSERLQNSESEERFDACCYLIRNASLIPLRLDFHNATTILR